LTLIRTRWAGPENRTNDVHERFESKGLTAMHKVGRIVASNVHHLTGTAQ